MFQMNFWPVYGLRRLRSTSWASPSKRGFAALTNPRQAAAPQLHGSFSVPQNLHVCGLVSHPCAPSRLRLHQSRKRGVRCEDS